MLDIGSFGKRLFHGGTKLKKEDSQSTSQGAEAYHDVVSEHYELQRQRYWKFFRSCCCNLLGFLLFILFTLGYVVLTAKISHRLWMPALEHWEGGGKDGYWNWNSENGELGDGLPSITKHELPVRANHKIYVNFLSAGPKEALQPPVTFIEPAGNNKQGSPHHGHRPTKWTQPSRNTTSARQRSDMTPAEKMHRRTQPRRSGTDRGVEASFPDGITEQQKPVLPAMVRNREHFQKNEIIVDPRYAWQKLAIVQKRLRKSTRHGTERSMSDVRLPVRGFPVLHRSARVYDTNTDTHESDDPDEVNR